MKKIFLTLAIAFSIKCAALNFPLAGNPEAKVHIVAFLEPKCPDSKQFWIESYPKIKKEYIDTGKANFSVITVSFLYKSALASLALLCVNNQDKTLYFDYLDYIYKNQLPEKEDWATKEKLIEYAKKANAKINIEKLHHCLHHEDFNAHVEENTAFGNLLMGHISTPKIFVNGHLVENIDDKVDIYQLEQFIDKELNQ